MTTVTEVLDQLYAMVETVEGVRSAKDLPPEEINAFPLVVIYVSDITFATISSGVQLLQADWTFNIELHVARKDLPRDYEKLLPLVDNLRAALMETIYAENISAQTLTATISGQTWGSTETLSWICNLTVRGF